MAYSVIGQVEASINGSGISSVSAPAFTPVAGNFLLCCVWIDGAHSTSVASTDIDDSTGSNDTWTHIAETDLSDSLGTWGFWYLKNAAAVSTTVRATFNSGAKDFPAIYVVEFSGLDATNPYMTGATQKQVTPGTGTDAMTSGNTGTLSAQPAAVFGFIFQTTGLGTPTAGTGFTALTGVWDFQGSQAVSVRPEHKRVTATTAVAATGTQAANGNAESAVIVLLEASSSATLKTLIGIADASLKNIDGLTKANTKTILGLTP